MLETQSLATWELATLLVGSGLTIALLVAGFLLRVTSVTDDDIPETDKNFPSLQPRTDALLSFRKKDKKSQKKFAFPPQEDKFARRSRWARVLAKGVRTVGGFSSSRKTTAVVRPREVSPEQVIAYFWAADRKQQLGPNGYNQGGNGGLIREGNAYGNAYGNVYGNGCGNEYGNGGLVRDVGPTGRLSKGGGGRGVREGGGRRERGEKGIGGMTIMEARRIKGRILRLLFEAGPSKALCPIREASWEGEERERGRERERERRGRSLLLSSVGGAVKAMATSALIWSRGGEEGGKEREMERERDIESGLFSEASSEELKRLNGSNVGVGGERGRGGEGEGEGEGGREGQEGEEGEKYHAVDLDLDPVVVIGPVGVSREMLWLALARLGGEKGREKEREREREKEREGEREREEGASQKYEFGSVDNV